MAKSFIELIVGSLDEKREYNEYIKRVKALPRDYRFAFKKIQSYLYNVNLTGCDMKLFEALVELFEASASQGRAVIEIIGQDVAGFCDELVLASSQNGKTPGEKLNEEILTQLEEIKKEKQ